MAPMIEFPLDLPEVSVLKTESRIASPLMSGVELLRLSAMLE